MVPSEIFCRKQITPKRRTHMNFRKLMPIFEAALKTDAAQKALEGVKSLTETKAHEKLDAMKENIEKLSKSGNLADRQKALALQKTVEQLEKYVDKFFPKAANENTQAVENPVAEQAEVKKTTKPKAEKPATPKKPAAKRTRKPATKRTPKN